ncbi:MAG: MCE family protein, partial [Phycisphaerales bacterium]|nr:MCE family protein [Phycisphaerales bacterium]
LQTAAAGVARAGSRFWVVRPDVGLDHVEGIDTLLGPRYLAVTPGEGARRRHFVGLERPPVIQDRQAGDLEVIVETPARGSLRAGTGVTYRGLRVGTVASVGLASDARSVEARIHIRQAYASIVRERTVFWDAGGVNAGIGWLSGLYVNVSSVESLLGGGVALATPSDAGDAVTTGHRFVLAPKAEDAWLQWKPSVSVGSALLPAGSTMPSPLRARLDWTEGRIFRDDESRTGWVLQLDDGLLGPADLLRVPDAARSNSTALEVSGERLAVGAAPDWTDGVLSRIRARLDEKPWPRARIRRPEAPEDCLVIADPAAEPLPVAAARLTVVDEQWQIDAAVSFDPTWHGAAVLSRVDGRLVGLLLVPRDDKAPASVALVAAGE